MSEYSNQLQSNYSSCVASTEGGEKVVEGLLPLSEVLKLRCERADTHLNMQL